MSTARSGVAEVNPFAQFLQAVSVAPNETSIRESFVVLAATAFAETGFATTLALGAEFAVSFREGGLIRRGRIDSFVDNVVVEFKHGADLAQDHFLNQLRGYVAGAWLEDNGYGRLYLCVLTNGNQWLVYAATPQNADAPPDSTNVNLSLVDEWSGLADDPDAPGLLAQFLNRLFFRRTLLRPSASNFARDFGVESPSFVAVSTQLKRVLRELGGEPQMQTHREAWSEDIRTSYGGVETPEELFVRHTYLALLTRLLVFVALEHRSLKVADLDAVLDGTYFVGKRIANLVEDDYFQWPLLASKSMLRESWAALVAQIGTYDLQSVREDVLKPLYEQLVDPETRHDLGEYYTPDWLAEEVVGAAVEPWLAAGHLPRILDPTCGSGSFLRAAIHRVRVARSTEAAESELAAVIEHVVGMDINPMAVTVAKATYLLAVADLLPHGAETIHIPVYLCNSLKAAERHDTSSLFGDQVSLDVGGSTFEVPLDLVMHGPDFDQAIAGVVAVARNFATSDQPAAAAADAVRARLAPLVDRYVNGELVSAPLAAMACQMVELVRAGRDTIHGFLLQNKYRSVLLYHQFDLVVGNPPWLTIADVSAPAYRDLILQRAKETRIAGRTAGEQAHTELATLFLAHVFRQFVSPSRHDDLPRVAFVMPRSIYTATHHRPLREGTYSGAFDVTELWDLAEVEPLFNVPSCVLFATAGTPRPSRPKRGRIYRGRLRERDPDIEAATGLLTKRSVSVVLDRLGKRSAWREASDAGGVVVVDEEPTRGAYQHRFRQGAVLYPQTLLCVQPVGVRGRGPGDVAIAVDPTVRRAAKVLREVELRGVVERSSLFCTAAAEHLLPYALSPNLWCVILPVLADPGTDQFRPVSPESLRSHGRVGTATWFEAAEAEWKRSQQRPGPPIWERVDHLGQLSAQAQRSRWVVLYTSAGSRPVAAVLDSSATEYPFVARDQTYWASFYNPEEAFYLSAILNSDQAAERIKAFMTTGLFGPRHIHKRVLDLPIPPFDKTNRLHAQIADLGRELGNCAADLVSELDQLGGRARSHLRTALPKDRRAAVERGVETLMQPWKGAG